MPSGDFTDQNFAMYVGVAAAAVIFLIIIVIVIVAFKRWFRKSGWCFAGKWS